MSLGRKLGLLVVCLAASGACGSMGATAAAAEEPPAWTVNGKPLLSGETTKFKLAARTPIKLSVPDLSLSVECQKFKDKGVLEGGEPGTSRLGEKIKPGKCSGTHGGTPEVFAIVIDIPYKCRTDGDWYNPFSWSYGTCHITIVIGEKGGSADKAGSSRTSRRVLTGGGEFDSVFEEGGVVKLPEPPLSSSTLQLEGHELIMTGELQMTLPKHARLGAGHI